MPYYNTSSPTSTSKNTINSIMTALPNIRDFLLNLNLRPIQMLPTGYSTNTAINGSPKVGQPVTELVLNGGANTVPDFLPLEKEGIFFKELNILVNTFKNTDANYNDLQSINYIQDVPFIKSTPNGAVSFGDAEWPQGTLNYPRSSNLDIDKYGLFAKSQNAFFRKDNVKKNLYLDSTMQIDVADFIIAKPLDIEKQINGYLNKNGSLNIGNDITNGFGVQAANLLGSALNGQGVGIGTNVTPSNAGSIGASGLVAGFDIRSSLAGRVLGGTGLLADTNLGKIGARELLRAIANNAAFNAQQMVLGKLNLKENAISLLKGDGFAGIRKNYTITVPGTAGKILGFAQKILGFTIPRSFMTDDSSIFQSESGEAPNIQRANELLKRTGKGQRDALADNMLANIFGTNPKDGFDSPWTSRDKRDFKNINELIENKVTLRTGYAPDFKGSTIGNGISEKDALLYSFTDPSNKGEVINLFSKSDGVIPDLNYLLSDKIDLDFPGFYKTDDYNQDDGCKDGINVNEIRYSWIADKDGVVNTKLPEHDKIFLSNTEDLPDYRKSLLFKTQVLFNSKGMKNIVTRKGEMNVNSSQIMTPNLKAISKGSAVLSKATYFEENGAIKGVLGTPEETFCRSWTTYSRYDTIDPEFKSGLIRSSRVYDDNRVPFRHDKNLDSVLEDTGFVKIAPYTNDFFSENGENKNDVARNAKNYMFSIENLAWHDDYGDLPIGEKGLGDPISGRKGRMMWFPPYDLNFSESVSVDWEANKFIGRGENIYTYNNTERSGQLSFKIIVDHSTYTNTFREQGTGGPSDNYVASFMAGCIEPSSIFTDRFTTKTISKIVPSTVEKPRQKVIPKPPEIPKPMKVFFPNDVVTLDSPFEKYEDGKDNSGNDLNWFVVEAGDGMGEYSSTRTSKALGNQSNTRKYFDSKDYGLNYKGRKTEAVIINNKEFRGWNDTGYFDEMVKFFKESCQFCKVTAVGFASAQGTGTVNQTLSKDRAIYMINKLKDKVGSKLGITKEEIEKRFVATTKDSKELAASTVTVENLVGQTGTTYEVRLKTSANQCRVFDTILKKNGKKPLITNRNGFDTFKQGMTNDIDYLFPSDSLGCKLDRFSEIQITYDADAALAAQPQPEPCIITTNTEVSSSIKQLFYNETMFFDKLKKTDKFIFDKFRQKIKYFHPAFHSTTPEGFNSRLTFLHQCTRQGRTFEALGPNNLAFGRAPVCILRIGDFFNTKIVIDSLNIDYEPLVWDLNPEGIGVQPMIANISMSFKFIGGESLSGPINKLQNALSFNFYANTRMYEARADYFSGDTQKVELQNGNKTVSPEMKNAKDGKVLSQKNSCDVNQALANQNTIANNNNNNLGGTATTATTATTVSDINKKFEVSINNYGSSTYNASGVFDGDINITIKYPSLEKDYKAKLILYDKLNIPKEINTFKIKKAGGITKESTPVVLNKNSFNFFTKSDGGTYQAKLEIIDLKAVVVDASNFNFKIDETITTTTTNDLA